MRNLDRYHDSKAKVMTHNDPGEHYMFIRSVPANDLTMAFLFVSIANTDPHATKTIHYYPKLANYRYMGLIELNDVYHFYGAMF